MTKSVPPWMLNEWNHLKHLIRYLQTTNDLLPTTPFLTAIESPDWIYLFRLRMEAIVELYLNGDLNIEL